MTPSLFKIEFEIPVRYLFETLPTKSEIPEERWTKTSMETSDPWQQYDQMRQWESSDEHNVRNVRLFRLASLPVWEEVQPDQPS